MGTFLEDEILARSCALSPRALANLTGLLYGSGAHAKSRAALQLRSVALSKLCKFSAAELVDLASGLTNAGLMDRDLLHRLRTACDALFEGDRREVEYRAAMEKNTRKLSAELGREKSATWPMAPEILMDFASTLVLSKPPGWSCATRRGTKKDPDGEGRSRHGEPPLISEYLQSLDKERAVSQDSSVDHGLTHRLDLETSGALLTAKTFQSYWRLRLDFSTQSVKRRYLALVHGALPLGEWQHVNLPLQLTRVPHGDSGRSVRSKSVVSHDFGRRGRAK